MLKEGLDVTSGRKRVIEMSAEEARNFFLKANSIINSNKKLKVIAYNGSGRILTL